ncbi:hypothetical protein BDF20DRAFT_912907 [Mycotypha africana]|uniref:uncharacterized protein n=1 Tax=Mycotypha africana TaxID=64632 RepID=UPI00230095A6|nr:uncharacterized protein BDF20DRAFT_912907 [Mycotypha africana]KAI8979287.1 hypothetical protein BDF20DRAFT_912907 [Mycotypha africana]
MESANIPLYYRHPYSGYRFEGNTNPSFYPGAISTFPSEDTFDDDNQIPSTEEFQAIIDDYLSNLSPKKRDKALVDQHRYYMIQQVLKDPRNTAISTAQFRFWVKKMFQLQPGPNDVVCHDNKPVAMKENIYDILVKAHREAHHGGRDKTSALVRKRYSWIPKELVARFVRHCPYCITRRNSGHSPNLATSPHSVPQARYSNRSSYCFDSGSSIIYTPPALKEDGSELSSGPPSSDVSYEVSPNYVSISTTSSPKESCYYSMHTKEDDSQVLIGCHNDHSFQSAAFDMNNSTIYLELQQHQRHEQPYSLNMHPNTIHPLGQQGPHSYPQTPLVYTPSQRHLSHGYQDYYAPATTASDYYCNGLGITHHYHGNSSLSSSETTSIHANTAPNTTTVHPTGLTTDNVAAEVAAAAFMHSATNMANAGLLSSNSTTSHDRPSYVTSSLPSATTTYHFYNTIDNVPDAAITDEFGRYHHPLDSNYTN